MSSRAGGCPASTPTELSVFGPVPSRRLGRSLGINNVPLKTCSFSCVYCQVGRTRPLLAGRKSFHDPSALVQQVHRRVDSARAEQQVIDYLAFVPDGEPTLDVDLGTEISGLRSEGLPIAVISNASLVDRNDVRRDLQMADWVSLKVDAVSLATWRKVDRPHRSLDLGAIHQGMRQFSESFGGELVTETMLVRGLNDDPFELAGIAEFLASINPRVAYLSAPTRPPAEAWVRVCDEDTLQRAYHTLSQAVERVELLIGYEGNAFASTGDAELDLLSICAVHPMRQEPVARLLERCSAGWDLVERLVGEQRLVEAQYRGHRYYLRPVRTEAVDRSVPLSADG